MTDGRQDYRRIYAIGDIHGRSDLLDLMIGLIDRDLAGMDGGECLTVIVGDYVDRGPDTFGVIGRLVQNPFPTPYVALKGNHEDMMLGFLRDPVRGGDLWAINGAFPALASYGVPVEPMREGRYEETALALLAAMPPEHAEFLASLRLSVSLPRFFFCHAGIRPGVPFELQSEHDLLWIREEFLNSTVDFGKRVIHGHTPVPEPEVRPNRIDIDTGAVFSNRLTCLVLEGESHRFLATA
jgi:serine/threonine protein phosphatase 1